MENQNDSLNFRNFSKSWQNSGKDSKFLTSAELYRVLRRNNLILRLRRRALSIVILCCIAPFLILSLSNLVPVSPLLMTVYIGFMVICGAESFYWWWRLGKVYHYMTIPVIEAQKKMDELDRLRRNIKIFGWIVGAPVLALLFYEIALEGQHGEIYGAIGGAKVGAAIGITWEILNRRQLRAVKKSFSDFEDSQDTPDDEYQPTVQSKE